MIVFGSEDLAAIEGGRYLELDGLDDITSLDE